MELTGVTLTDDEARDLAWLLDALRDSGRRNQSACFLAADHHAARTSLRKALVLAGYTAPSGVADEPLVADQLHRALKELTDECDNNWLALKLGTSKLRKLRDAARRVLSDLPSRRIGATDA